jgi:hypothetical protein
MLPCLWVGTEINNSDALNIRAVWSESSCSGGRPNAPFRTSNQTAIRTVFGGSTYGPNHVIVERKNVGHSFDRSTLLRLFALTTTGWTRANASLTHSTRFWYRNASRLPRTPPRDRPSLLLEPSASAPSRLPDYATADCLLGLISWPN